MVAKPRPTKADLVDIIIKRQKEVLNHKYIEDGLINAVVPLSAMDGKIISFTEDGMITIEFSTPISGYLDYITKKELQDIIEMLDAEAEARKGSSS